MTSKPLVVEEAVIGELVKTNILLTILNNLIESSTIPTDKVELIELPMDSKLPTGLRFVDLSILSDMFSSFFLDIEDEIKDLEDLSKLNAETVNLSIAFLHYVRLTAPKTIVVSNENYGDQC